MTSTTGNNKGFTLVEMLVVLLIIGVMVSIATISIKAARPSNTQTLFNNIKNQFRLAIDFSQLRNTHLRIGINSIEKDGDSHQTKIQQLAPSNGKWRDNISIMPNTLKWQNDSVSMNVDTVFILPNGFITPAIVKFKFDDESYQFDTTKL